MLIFVIMWIIVSKMNVVDIPETSAFPYFYFQKQNNSFRLSIVNFLVQVQVLMKYCMKKSYFFFADIFIFKLASISRHHSNL